MDGDGDLPALPLPPTRPPAPPPPRTRPPAPPEADGAAPKRKTQRRLGLAPRPLNAATGASSASPERATAGEDEVVVVPSSQGRKRTPCDPSTNCSTRKVKRTATAPRAPLHPTPCTSSGAPAATPHAPTATLNYSATDAKQVFDGMPTSIDDETFLSILNGHNFGTDMDPTIDIDDNGDVLPHTPDDEYTSDVDGDAPQKKGSRGVNFTIDEDETLVKAWQTVTLDPIVGDEQTGATYWKRIYDHFRRNNKNGIFRSQVSVTHRWHTIQVSCTKWSACLENVRHLNPSGSNAQDKVNIAQRLYKSKPKKKGGKPGKAFALHHCWVLLEHDEKWRIRNQEVPTKSKKLSNSCSPIDEDVEYDSNDADSNGRRSPIPNSVPSEKRPPGRKAEKEKLKKGVESMYKESLDNMVASRKELAADRKEFKAAKWVELKEMQDRRTTAEERRTAAEERRTAAEERRAAAEERRAAAEEQRVAVEERRVAAEEAAKRLEQEQRIMFMDPSNLDEKGRAYFELMRDQVLATRSGLFMGGFMGGNGGSADFGPNGPNGSSTDMSGGCE